MDKIAYNYLLKNELLNIDMLQIISHHSYKLLYASMEGVLLYSEDAEVLMLSVDNLVLGEALIKKYIKLYPAIVLHQKELEAVVKKYIETNERIECYQEVFKENISVVLPDNVEIKLLTLKEHHLVCQYYGHMSDPNYITEIIESGWMYGLYENDFLAGFIGRHKEGSMGILEIIPKYKRKHYATYLISHMINEYHKRNWTPYSQVEKDNLASLQLHQKMKAKRSDELVLWLI